MGIKVKTYGGFENTRHMINSVNFLKMMPILDKYGQKGVYALIYKTPKDTFETSESWDYEIHRGVNHIQIVWTNDNLTRDGVPVAILLQYGHGTKNGGYVQGIDYINPALRPIFEELADKLWMEVVKT